MLTTDQLMPDDCLRLLPWFADPDALVPRVLQIGVNATSAGSEPRTTATATTHFARLPNAATCWTYDTNDRRRRDCICSHVDIGHKGRKREGESYLGRCVHTN